jgi:hypothetical protein
MKTTWHLKLIIVPWVRGSIRCPPLRRALLLIPLVLVCFGLLPSVQATDLGSVVGGSNTADGSGVLLNLTTGTNNSGFGYFALHANTSGTYNSAEGFRALFSNTTGVLNTATGVNALFSNTTASYNTANGTSALFHNTTGSQNTATGTNALANTTTGNANTAIGVNALNNNNSSGYNTAVGHSALVNAHNSGVGFGFNGSLNVGIGYNAGSGIGDGARNVCIGANVLGNSHDHDTIRIGTPPLGSLGSIAPKTFISGIRGITTVNANAIAVVIDSAGQLGTVSSSERFKKEIKPMDKTSEAILALKPVTFHCKSDSTNTPQFGLIVEEVGKVDPDLVVRDEKGEIYTVRYEAVNAMLLNEFLKEHRKMEQQETTISQLKSAVTKQEATATEQKKEIADLTTSLKEQAAQIQKVSAQLELSKSAPQTVKNTD